MTDKEIITIVDEAITNTKSETRSLTFGSSERAFAHRFAVHLELVLSNESFDVDCEYNRQGEQAIPKELVGIRECDSQKSTDRIMPDVIIHKRGGHENILVVEIKNNNGSDLCDKKKLELFTRLDGEYKYRLGLYIDIANGQWDQTWYKNGDSTSPEDITETSHV